MAGACLNLQLRQKKRLTLLEATGQQKGENRFLSCVEVEKLRPHFHLVVIGEMHIATVSLPGLSDCDLFQMQAPGVDEIKGKDLGEGLRIEAAKGQTVLVDIEDSPRTSAGDHEEINIAQSLTFSSLTEEYWWQVMLDAQVIHEKPPKNWQGKGGAAWWFALGRLFVHGEGTGTDKFLSQGRRIVAVVEQKGLQ